MSDDFMDNSPITIDEKREGAIFDELVALRKKYAQLRKRIAAYEGKPNVGIINIVAKSISDCMHKYWNDRMLTYWKEELYADSLMGEKWHANAAITAFQKAVRDTLSEGE